MTEESGTRSQGDILLDYDALKEARFRWALYLAAWSTVLVIELTGISDMLPASLVQVAVSIAAAWPLYTEAMYMNDYMRAFDPEGARRFGFSGILKWVFLWPLPLLRDTSPEPKGAPMRVMRRSVVCALLFALVQLLLMRLAPWLPAFAAAAVLGA